MLSLLCFFALSAHAEPITVLLQSAPGGLYDVSNRALIDKLSAAGIKTDYQRVTGCKGAEAWLKNNPGRPVIMSVVVEEEVNRRLNPKADNACDLNFTKDRILSASIVTNISMCSMLPEDQALQKLLKGRSVIAATNVPSTNSQLLNGLIRSLNIDAKSVVVQGQAKLMQALISGDVDFVVLGNVQNAVASGARCFLTTGDKAEAQRVGRTSLATISANNPWIDAKQFYTFYGANLDRSRIVPIVIDTVRTHPDIQKNLATGFRLAGQPSGANADQEWQQIERHIQQYLK